MKKLDLGRKLIIGAIALSLVACGGHKAVKKPMEKKPPLKAEEVEDKPGGYYKDDGPGDKIPENLDSIPDAVPQYEEYSTRANQPYIALEKRYVPMSSYAPYKKQGMASWYGKRYHGGKTSTGEIYDMYGMTAAHKTLPIPSYARVTNLQSGKSVVVRINDRGPFINGRVIDLSYVAAYKLNMIEAGQTMVEIEAIDTRPQAMQQTAEPIAADAVNAEVLPETRMPAPVVDNSQPPMAEVPTVAAYDPAEVNSGSARTPVATDSFFVQVGAFNREENSYKLMDRLAGFNSGSAAHVFQEQSGSVYRVKVGPYSSKSAAQQAMQQIQEQYNIKGLVQ